MSKEGAEVTSAGRAFQTRAPATEKARRPTVGSLTAGTHRSSEVEDRSLCRVVMSSTDVNCCKYWGHHHAVPGKSALRPWTESVWALVTSVDWWARLWCGRIGRDEISVDAAESQHNGRRRLVRQKLCVGCGMLASSNCTLSEVYCRVEALKASRVGVPIEG